MKKLFALFFALYLSTIPGIALAQDCCGCNTCRSQPTGSASCLANPVSNAPCNCVNSNDDYYILLKGNVIKLAFECKFLSECAKEGDCIYFYVPKDIVTECGQVIIPMGSKFSGTIRGIYSQKKFNKNARVYLTLNKLTLPDGTELDVKVKPFSKDFSLVENGWMTAGKLAASTVGLGVVGAGAGAGLAFIPSPQKIAVGAAAIGVPVGCFIGLVTGLVTPGLKYHAKQGEEIKFILCEDLCVPKCSVDDY